MPTDDPNGPAIERIEDAAELFERRLASPLTLRVALDRGAAALRATEPDVARVLDALVAVVDAVTDSRPEEARWYEVSKVVDDLRAVLKARARRLADAAVPAPRAAEPGPGAGEGSEKPRRTRDL